MSMRAPATEAVLLARLAELGIAATTHRHVPVFTVEEAKALRGHLPGGHAKNLFLKDKKDRLYLAVVEEDCPVDMKSLAKTLGAARLSFGSADLLMAALGVAPGAVTPFALINDREARVRAILDKGLMARDPVNFHPLHNAATTALSPAGLLTFLRATGHEPDLVDFRVLASHPI